MPEFYTWAVLLINQLGEIGEKQLSFFGSRGGQICPLMHVPFSSSLPSTTEAFIIELKYFDILPGMHNVLIISSTFNKCSWLH